MTSARLTEQTAELNTALAGRYADIRPLASGGMAQVYVAKDLQNDRDVAIKVLNPDLLNDTGSRRFDREIRIAKSLSHPNIVPVYESGDAGRFVYYVMPLISGITLREKLRQDVQLPIDEAIHITQAVGDALTYAHGHGIVHRDVKPENIILESGRVLVMDFGIAKRLQKSATDSFTTGRAAIGTIQYMSPEQASASGHLDERSDIYSLGLVLYEMIAGEVPFKAATPEATFARKAVGRYAPLRDLRATVPPNVDDAIQKALQPAPADRFRSVSEFIHALSSPTASASARPIISARSLWLAAAFAVVLLIGLILAKRERSPNETAPLVGLGRIVVAPFANRTADSSFNAIGMMAADWVTDGLQRTGIVEVVPTPAMVQAARYLSSDTSSLNGSQAFAAETGANTVISGSYYEQNGQLVLHAIIADRAGRRVVGSVANVTTPAADPVRGIEELRSRLMGWFALRYDERLNVTGSEDNRPPTYDAYRLFSDGMTKYVAVDNKSAFPLFVSAYQADSSFVVAALYASIALSNIAAWHEADSMLNVVNARRQSLSDYNRAWLDYRIAFLHGDRAGALAAIRKAARQAPQSKAAYNHALEALYAGYLNEALRALQSLPSDHGPMRDFAPYWDVQGTILHCLGRYAEEREVGLRGRKMYPERLTMFRSVARSFVMAGQIDSIRPLTRLAEAMAPDPVGWDYGQVLSEIAEELSAHGHARDAAIYFRDLRRWLLANQRAPNQQWRVVNALYSLREWKAARTALSALREKDPTNVDYLGMAGLIAARLGERTLAISITDSLAANSRPYTFGARPYYQARIASVLGDRETAMAALNRSFAEGRSFNLPIHREIDFESLHDYQPFRILLRGKN